MQPKCENLIDFFNSVFAGYDSKIKAQHQGNEQEDRQGNPDSQSFYRSFPGATVLIKEGQGAEQAAKNKYQHEYDEKFNKHETGSFQFDIEL